MAKGPNPPKVPPGRNTTSSIASRLEESATAPIRRPQDRRRLSFLVSFSSLIEAVLRAFSTDPRAFSGLPGFPRLSKPCTVPFNARFGPLVSRAHLCASVYVHFVEARGSGGGKLPLTGRTSPGNIDGLSIRCPNRYRYLWIGSLTRWADPVSKTVESGSKGGGRRVRKRDMEETRGGKERGETKAGMDETSG